MAVREVAIGAAVFGRPGPLGLIAGPCVIESETLIQETAGYLRDLCAELDLPFVFKSSFDKANRTGLRSFRGPGLERGLEMLRRVREQVGVAVISDVHVPSQVAPAAEVLDALQIPAFLCRQTDLILAAASTGKPLNIKKGQFLAPQDMRFVAEKAESTGNRDLLLTERGTTFGYHNLVVDMRSIALMRSLGYPVVFDATHSVQSPGGLGGASGGERGMVGTLARAAVAAGCDALFLEVHPDPDRALCDGPSMLPLAALRELLETCLALRTALEGDRR